MRERERGGGASREIGGEKERGRAERKKECINESINECSGTGMIKDKSTI